MCHPKAVLLLIYWQHTVVKEKLCNREPEKKNQMKNACYFFIIDSLVRTNHLSLEVPAGFSAQKYS
jgi:hypothetical protein